MDLMTFDNLWLKEIVVVTGKEQKSENTAGENENLKIAHQYLLIYEVVK